uniref:Uncharacterized protein n=1 Tax=Toxoplasma gondii (strain ATCC 50861 / VEG) TaxID=432359 RepID=A0A0F7V2Q6_TOXGV|nr:TPA: hypothetical protein BN1205_063590 [Toxoplasma gondii VEG]
MVKTRAARSNASRKCVSFIWAPGLTPDCLRSSSSQDLRSTRLWGFSCTCMSFTCVAITSGSSAPRRLSRCEEAFEPKRVTPVATAKAGFLIRTVFTVKISEHAEAM